MIQDQGVTLFETGACLLYLADRYGKGEYGPGHEDQGRGEFPRLASYLEAMRGRDAALEVGLSGR